MRFDRNQWRMWPSAAVVVAMLCIPTVSADAQDVSAQSAAASFDIMAFQVRGNTVLAPDDMLRVIEMGADAMETDYPAALKSLLPPK